MPDEVGGYTPDERVTRLEVQMVNNTAQVLGLTHSVDRLADRVAGRPSWAVVTLLSFSAMANGALLTAVIALLSTR